MTRRPCPTGHRNVEEDGVRIVKSPHAGGWKREAWVLMTCRDCGQRLQERWELRRVESKRWPMPMAPDGTNG